MSFPTSSGTSFDARNLGRLATVDPAGQPQVVPVGEPPTPHWTTIDVSGPNFAASRKSRNAAANPKAAF
ncbi:MAG: pyridoxamine 5'-phosphate oxidase family protein [Actinomycetota bacterium]|nr:pyridoxamine 5'-phosphate oxidase family protein [Actinomycetota bacterium]